MLTVRDIMHEEVVTVLPDTSVRELSRLLADEEISGAPVVDGNGSLLGVVSATDVVRLAANDAATSLATLPLRARQPTAVDPDDPEEPEVDPFGFFLPEDSPYGNEEILSQFAESELDSVVVADIMTPVTFSVEPTVTLRELAQFLVRGRIHRAVVVEDERLKGIVTSGDVLQAVADGRLG
jgi:CBS domain-containing protein